MIINEQIQRGTEDFPIDYYRLDENHPKYIMHHHWHREIEIIRVLSGSLSATLNNTEIEIVPGDIVFVNPDTVHGAVPHNCVYECVVFDPQKVLISTDEGKRFALGLVNHNLFLFHRIKQGKTELTCVADSLFQAFSNCSDYYRLTVIGKIYELFAVICKYSLYSENSEFGSFLKDKNIIKLKRAIEFIRQNYTSNLTLREIAQAVDVSPKYLCVFFRQMTGMSTFEYLNTYRVEKASKALISTDASITDIAFSCGFNDLSYFIKTFKKIKGVTPKSFRNSVF